MKYLYIVIIVLFLSTVLQAQSDFIHPSKTGTELIDSLQLNYSATSPKSYNAARDAMFEQIDKKNGNQISCVYTGYTITFTDRQDAQGNQSASDFNTEHIWPQSFFDSDLPMRADIHHLYPTRVDVNGARSNFKFAEIPDQNTNVWYRENSNQTSIPTENIDEYSELLNGTSFEPREDHKGNVARAIFYFWTIYQDNSSIVNDGTDNAAFFDGMKDDLLEWHDLDPVDQEEVARSLAIEQVQGNRNPFVHDTTLVRRAFFGGLPVSNEEADFSIPDKISLSQNFPNPFNPTTNIKYSLLESGTVQLKVFDIWGREMAELENGMKTAGEHSIAFDASQLSSGVYIYQLKVGNSFIAKKMLLIK